MRKSRSVVAIASILLAVLATNAVGRDSAASSEAHPSTARVVLAPCDLEGFPFPARCGHIEVPEDRERSDRMLELDLIVLPAREGTAAPDPVVYLVGGPGVAATKSAAFFAASLQNIQANREVILLDQRGTESETPLRCRLGPEETAQLLLGLAPTPGLESCVNDLNADKNLYTSEQIVDDLEDARRALGYEKLNLIGISYGSRVALAYLRDHPDRVRTATLRGAAAPAANIWTEVLEGCEQVLSDVLSRCERDPSCRSAFPEVRSHLALVLARLETEPYVARLDGGSSITVDRRVFSSVLRYSLYSDRGAAAVPMMIETAYRGRMERFVDAALPAAVDAGGRFSAGAFLSAICREDVPFIPTGTWAESDGVFTRPDAVRDVRELCRQWAVEPISEAFKTPVKSDVPVLLLSGSADPATPAAGAEAIARDLSNSLHVVSQGLGHHPSWTSCYADLTTAFIDRGSVQGLEHKCVGEFRRASFLTAPAWMLALRRAAIPVTVMAIVLLAAATILWRRGRRRPEPAGAGARQGVAR